MSGKPAAFLVTALVAAPVRGVCILGPAAVGGFLAGWFGWLADLDLTVLGGMTAIGVLGFFKYRRAPRPQ